MRIAYLNTVDKIKIEIDGINFDWYNPLHTPEFYSIPRYVEENEDRLKNIYLDFISDLSSRELNKKNEKIIDYFQLNADYNLWWMTLVYEKNLVKSPAISDCIKILALEEILICQKIERLKVYTQHKNLSISLKFLCNKLDILYCSNGRGNPNILQDFVDRFIHGFKGIFFLFRTCILLWPLRNVFKHQWINTDNQIFIFSWFFNMYRENKNTCNFRSRYWETLPNLLQSKNTNINFLDMYISGDIVKNATEAATWCKIINEKNKKEVHKFVFSYLTIGVLVKTLYFFFRINVKFIFANKLIEIFTPISFQSSLFFLLKLDWNLSCHGSVLIDNILNCLLIDKSIKSLQYHNVGLFLQENMPIERAFIQAWRKYGHGTLIGVPHATIRYWDMRYFEGIYDKNSSKLPRPDIIAVNGPVAFSMIKKFTCPQIELVEVEALRYLESINKEGEKKMIKNEFGSILICGDIDGNSTQKMLECVETVFLDNSRFENFSIGFKSHPANKINLDDYNIPNLQVVDSSLSSVLRHYDIVLSTDSTSAGVEAYLEGLFVIVFSYNSRLNFSPLKGVDNVSFFSNADGLIKILNTYSESSIVKLKINNFFWRDENLVRWNDFFHKIGIFKN